MTVESCNLDGALLPHRCVKQVMTLRSLLVASGVAVTAVSLAAVGYARIVSNWSFASLEDNGRHLAEIIHRGDHVASEQPSDPGRTNLRKGMIGGQGADGEDGEDGEDRAENVSKKMRMAATISDGASHRRTVVEAYTSVENGIFRNVPINPETVWERLLEVERPKESPERYGNQETHVLQDFHDQGKVMAAIDGVVVVRRMDLLEDAVRLYPANGLDFVPTFQSYFSIFERSLVPRLFLTRDVHNMWSKRSGMQFWQAVTEGEDVAAMYLSTYYNWPKNVVLPVASAGYEPFPSVSSMADVYITSLGSVFNKKDLVVLKTCKRAMFTVQKPKPPRSTERFEKVFVMTQHWGDGYFHFVSECLPRICLMLDLLLDHPDIKIAVHEMKHDSIGRREYMSQFMELLGLSRSRLVFIGKKPIHAEVAFIPESTPCGQPMTAGIILLRSALLKALYPATEGVVPPTSRPVIIVIVRKAKRGLENSAEVEEALRRNFSGHDVVQFLGTGSIRSQLLLFSKASLIVAPHGAGLSNMMVAPLHTPVLEIGPPACPDCYVQLALKLQHVYGRHSADDRWNAACDRSYKPDVSEVMAIARALMEAGALFGTTDLPPAGVQGGNLRLAANISG